MDSAPRHAPALCTGASLPLWCRRSIPLDRSLFPVQPRLYEAYSSPRNFKCVNAPGSLSTGRALASAPAQHTMSRNTIAIFLVVLAATMPLAPAMAKALPGSADGSPTALGNHDATTRGGPTSYPAHNLAGPSSPWWTTWSHDQDRTQIDDALEAFPWTTDARFDVFVRFSSTVDDEDARAVARITGTPAKAFPLADAVYAVAVSPFAFAHLLDLTGVVGIEQEQRVLPVMTVAHQASLTLFSLDLGNGAIGRWHVTGRGVVTAVLDTGIDQEHEAFWPEQFIGGYDATIPTGRLRDQATTLSFVTVPDDISTETPLAEVDPDDDVPNTHGTHVAGAAFGQDPNGTHIGGAPDGAFLDIKVLGGELESRSDLPFGLGSTVIEGLEFVRRYNEGRSYLGDPGNDTVRLVTLSLAETRADPAGDTTLAHAVNRLVDTGVNVIAAAGNCGMESSCAVRGNNTIAAPGSARQAITVGAYDDAGTARVTDDVLAPYSSHGPNGGEPKPNLVAPGTDIIAPQGNPASGARATNGYSNATGTSMAVPIVASAVALMLEANPDLTPAALKQILLETTRDVGDHGWDAASGAGALNTYFAVGVALGFLEISAPVDDTGHEIDTSIEEKDLEPEKPRVSNQAPTVAFAIHPRVASPGQVVIFIDKSTDRERDSFASHNWDFGDGITAKGDRAAHKFDKPGEYVVRLSVTDVRGASGYHRETVIVLAPEGETKESPGAGFAIPLTLGLLVLMAGRRFRTPPALGESRAPRQHESL